MKAVLISMGIVVLVLGAVFCWLLIAGADQSRRRDKKKDDKTQ